MMASASVRSKGAVLFAAVGATQAEAKRKLGVRSEGLIAMWKNGQRVPKLANRKQLLAKYKIPIEAWDEPPDSPSEWGNAAAMGQVEMLEAFASKVRGEIASGESTMLEKIKMARELARLEEELRRLKGADVVEIDVIRHPKWLALKTTILSVLERHPDALRDVVAALERQEQADIRSASS